MTRYFLDTTAHVERWAGDAQRQQYVGDALRDDLHATSSHALREWKHIVDGACTDILNALRKRPTTLGAVFASLSQGWGRTPGHRLRVLSIVMGGDTAIDADLMEIRASQLVRYKSHEMFHDRIEDVRNGSECGLAENVVRRDDQGRWEFLNVLVESQWCKKTDHICRQDDDLDSKLARMQAAAAALGASPTHNRMAKAVARAATNREERKGQACFRHLGDVSIALECRSDEILLTTDSSFDVMAPALGLTVERFDATPPP